MGFSNNPLLDPYNPRWRRSAILKIDMTSFFCRGQNDMPTAVTWSKSKPEVQFQYGGHLFFETGNSYILAVDWVITTKFGLLIDTDILKRATSPNSKPDAKLRRSGRRLENRYNIISPLRMDRFGRNSVAEWYSGETVKIETGSGNPIWRTVVFPNRK